MHPLYNRLKKNNHTIISTDAKSAVQNTHHFMIKTLSNLGTDGNFLNLIKNAYKKPTANLRNGENLKAFPLRSRMRQKCCLSLLLFNTVLGVLAKAIRQEKDIESTQIGKEEIKLFIDDMIIYVENLKNQPQPQQSSWV